VCSVGIFHFSCSGLRCQAELRRLGPERTYPVSGSPTPGLGGMAVKQGKGVMWLFLKINLPTAISMKMSCREISIDVVILWVIFPGPRIHMDFQKSTVTHLDIHDFWMLVFNCPYKRGYPHWYPSNDIHARTLMELCGTWISTNGYRCFYGYQSSIIYDFMDIHLDIDWFLWMFKHGLGMDSRSRV